MATGLAGCLSGELSAEETVTERRDAAEVTSLSVEVVNGEVSVLGEERGTVEIRGQKRTADEDDLDDVYLETNREGPELTVTVEDDTSDGLLSFGPDPETDLELTVPDSLASVTAETTNGDVAVDQLDSDVTLETTNGDIVAQDLGGAVTAESTNGTVYLELAESHNVSVETTNGDIDLTLPPSIPARFSLDTTNGEVSVTDLDGLTVDGKSTVEAELGDVAHRIDCETTNGDVAVRGRL